MDSDIFSSGPVSRLDRLGMWTRARKWRQWLVLGTLGIVGWVILFSAWIGVAILRNSTDRDAGGVALNLVLMPFVAIVVLILLHRTTYRRFWRASRQRTMGESRAADFELAYGSEPAARPPRIDWPWTLRLRHALMYLIGVATLLYMFVPYGHQRAIIRFVTAHSAGQTSAGTLSALLFGYLPMAALVFLAMFLTQRQMRRRDAGLLDARGKLLLEAETNWLFSFAAAFTAAALLCRMAGGLIVAYL